MLHDASPVLLNHPCTQSQKFSTSYDTSFKTKTKCHCTEKQETSVSCPTGNWESSPKLVYSCFSTAFDLLNCITCAGHLYVAPCQTQSMSSNTQLFILGFTAFIEINWHTTLKNKGTLWQILPRNSAGLAAGFQPHGMAVHSLASSPCHGSPLSTTCCQVAGMDAGQENAEQKSENSNFLAGIRERGCSHALDFSHLEVRKTKR